jgi:hypothetical protein
VGVSAWTKGPWKVNKYGSVGAGATGAAPIVAHIEPFYGEDQRHGDDCANASLIAAAPDLYAALEEWHSVYAGWDDHQLARRTDPATVERVKRTSAALARARGETP